jgi:2-dehydropantoate 2-reductase
MLHNNLPIYIIGAGAIGKALAVFLQQDGKNVLLLRAHTQNILPGIERIEVELNNNIIAQEIRVNTLQHYTTLNGTIVLTNKSYGNHILAETLKNKIGNSPLVILQNGLNIEQPFINNGFAQIYRAVLFATSQPVSNNRLRFKPVTSSPIGIIKAKKNYLDTISTQLNSGYFPFRPEKNIEPVIWTKAIVNSVFNSVCPLLDTDNGIFYRNQYALTIAQNMIAEAVVIAAAKGVQLNKAAVVKQLLLISQRSDGQCISTLLDIKNKRPTEIETLNLAIAQIAADLNMEAVIQQTKLLGQLVHLKAQLALSS